MALATAHEQAVIYARTVLEAQGARLRAQDRAIVQAEADRRARRDAAEFGTPEERYGITVPVRDPHSGALLGGVTYRMTPTPVA